MIRFFTHLWRHAWQFVIWFVVGMVCFHATLLLMGVSWIDILVFWAAVFGGFLGTTMTEWFMAKRLRKAAEKEAAEDEAWLEERRKNRIVD